MFVFRGEGAVGSISVIEGIEGNTPLVCATALLALVCRTAVSQRVVVHTWVVGEMISFLGDDRLTPASVYHCSRLCSPEQVGCPNHWTAPIFCVGGHFL